VAALAMLAFFVLPTMRGRREEMFADAD
jgi:hypothetical protein